jgi:hypothetical protein
MPVVASWEENKTFSFTHSGFPLSIPSGNADLSEFMVVKPNWDNSDYYKYDGSGGWVYKTNVSPGGNWGAVVNNFPYWDGKWWVCLGWPPKFRYSSDLVTWTLIDHCPDLGTGGYWPVQAYWATTSTLYYCTRYYSGGSKYKLYSIASSGPPYSPSVVQDPWPTAGYGGGRTPIPDAKTIIDGSGNKRYVMFGFTPNIYVNYSAANDITNMTEVDISSQVTALGHSQGGYPIADLGNNNRFYWVAESTYPNVYLFSMDWSGSWVRHCLISNEGSWFTAGMWWWNSTLWVAGQEGTNFYMGYWVPGGLPTDTGAITWVNAGNPSDPTWYDSNASVNRFFHDSTYLRAINGRISGGARYDIYAEVVIYAPPIVYDMDPDRGDVDVIVTTGLFFKIRDDMFGHARNTMQLTINNVPVVANGLLSGGWALRALPMIYDVWNNNDSSGRANWASFDTSMEDSVYYDDFADTYGDWDLEYNDNERSRRWNRYVSGSGTITKVSGGVRFQITGIGVITYLKMAGTDIGSQVYGGGHFVHLIGDFDVQAMFAIDTINPVSTSIFCMKLTTGDHDVSQQIHIERYRDASTGGFRCIQGQPVVYPWAFDWSGGYIQASSTLSGGLRVQRTGSTVDVYYNEGTGWNLLHSYTGATTGSLMWWLGAFTHSTSNDFIVDCTSVNLSVGTTDKNRDIGYNFIPPSSSFKQGSTQIPEITVGNYRDSYLTNWAWRFEVAAGTPYFQNPSPSNINNAVANTDIYFELRMDDGGIDGNSIDVELERYSITYSGICDFSEGYTEDALIDGVAQSGYSASYGTVNNDRILLDRFLGVTIDTVARWDLSGATVGLWTQNNGLFFDSNGETGASKVSSYRKGMIQGDFDVLIDFEITDWASSVGNNYIMLQVADPGGDYVRVGRYRSGGTDVYRSDKNGSSNITQVNTSLLTDLHFRLKRSGSNITAWYYDSSNYEWVQLGSNVSLSSNDLNIEIECSAASAGDDVEATIQRVEVLSGSGTWPGGLNVTISVDDLYDAEEGIKVNVSASSWSGGSLDDTFEFAIAEDQGNLPHIKFSYPADSALYTVRIEYGVDVKAPNLKVTKQIRQSETAGGVFQFRDIGVDYEEDMIELEVKFVTCSEASAFRDFFMNKVRGKSRIFKYKNYVTNVEENVRLLDDSISTGDGGDGYAFKILMRKE